MIHIEKVKFEKILKFTKFYQIFLKQAFKKQCLYQPDHYLSMMHPDKPNFSCVSENVFLKRWFPHVPFMAYYGGESLWLQLFL